MKSEKELFDRKEWRKRRCKRCGDDTYHWFGFIGPAFISVCTCGERVICVRSGIRGVRVSAGRK